MSAKSPPSTDVLSGFQLVNTPLKLLVVLGADRGAEMELGDSRITIGTDPQCSLILHDPAVSRVHLSAKMEAGRVVFTDEGSTNGTFCNGVRFQVVEATPGARLELGRTELRLVPLNTKPSLVQPSSSSRFGGLAGRSLKMRELFGHLERLAPAEADVLILGESGTGKEECARAIHQASSRAKAPWVVCDLSSLSPTLLEAELFGQVKGAFTGAINSRRGVFERADGGTIFLDEVGELPLEAQPRLLRLLEERQVKRIGSDTVQQVNVRVLAATNRDLASDVKAGRFREDLYHRLGAVQIVLPPLRDHMEDIPMLVEYLLKQLGRDSEDLDPGMWAPLTDYAWPGNVRELRNFVEQALTIGSPTALPKEARSNPEGDFGRPLREAKQRRLEAFERSYVRNLLNRFEGNVSKAAKAAGIARSHMHRLIAKYNLRHQA